MAGTASFFVKYARNQFILMVILDFVSRTMGILLLGIANSHLRELLGEQCYPRDYTDDIKYTLFCRLAWVMSHNQTRNICIPRLP